MNKKAMTAAVLAALSVPAATGYAAQNPFKDLPEGHWAYDAVTMLRATASSKVMETERSAATAG